MTLGDGGMTWTEWAPASSISGPPALCVQIPVDEFPPLEERRSVVGDDGTFDNLRFLREQLREMVADIVGGYSD